jgi:hypothetical protein
MAGSIIFLSVMIWAKRAILGPWREHTGVRVAREISFPGKPLPTILRMTVTSALRERSCVKEAITRSEAIMSIKPLPRSVVSTDCGNDVPGLKMEERSNGIQDKMS